MYGDLIATDALSDIASDQSMITWFMENIVLVTLAMGALSMIIVFSKIFGTPGDIGAGGDI